MLLRNIHAGFEPILPQKAHGYCVTAFCAATVHQAAGAQMAVRHNSWHD
jgi:hypothetical protein